MEVVEGDEGVEMFDITELKELQKSIPEVFYGKSVLITGVTGFIGKALLEKLLRCCEGIRAIYVVIRPNKRDDASTRLKNLFIEEVFERIRMEHRHMFDRVFPLSGDVAEYDFGLLPTDVEMIMNDVSFVFHSAANVRFEEELKTAISVNLLGVQNLMELCKKMTNLEAIVHVSTAYALCNWGEINEDVYPEKVKPEDVISLLRWIQNDSLADLFKRVSLDERPSIYHYTKALAENLIHKERKQMPTCIVRPSIVTAAWKDPFPGWIDTYYGPSGLIAASGQGILRTVLAYPNVTADFVPVDVVVNTLIASAWKLAVDKPPTLQVVNCTSHPENLITWGKVEKICHRLILKYPSMTLVRYPGGSFKSSVYRHKLSLIFSHVVPGIMIDAFSLIIGRKRMLMKMYAKIHKVLRHLEYFTTNNFVFHSANFVQLNSELKEQDSTVFSIDLKQLYWPEYMEDYVIGIRKFLLKEQLETLNKARTRMVRIYYLWLGMKSISVLGALWFVNHFSPPCLSLAMVEMNSYIKEKVPAMIGNISTSFKQ